MTLPEGWTVDAFQRNGEVVTLQYRKWGYVTIDYRLRDFELGMTANPRGSRRRSDPIPARYQGRGWRGNLERDAMFALTKIYKDEK